MPKTLTNDLFLSNDLDYISSVYKYIFKQIHGIELKGKIEEHIYITKQSKVNTTIVSTNSVESSLEIELSAFKEFTSRDNTVQKEIITKLNELGSILYQTGMIKKQIPLNGQRVKDRRKL